MFETEFSHTVTCCLFRVFHALRTAFCNRDYTTAHLFAKMECTDITIIDGSKQYDCGVLVANLASIKRPATSAVIDCGKTGCSHVITLPQTIGNRGRPDRTQHGKLFDFEESLWFGVAHLSNPFHMLSDHEFAGWEASCVVEVSVPPCRFHRASPDQSKPTP
jgi:hypothetical protein